MTVLQQEVTDGIMILTLNRPDALNALNHTSLKALQAAFTEAQQDKAVKGLVITGAGKAFCAGADIKELASCDALTGYEFARLGQQVFRQLETLGKPSIALINGVALGGGCELIQAATLRIASIGARFGQPEIKLGIMPGYGGTQRLARLIGKGRALDLCLSGRLIEAEVACHWGLVSEVVAPHQLMERGLQVLTQITGMAPLALTAMMEVIDQGIALPLEEALQLEALYFAKLCATQDKAEGVAAFLEKRAASFQGR